jgi:hypothetical protein
MPECREFLERAIHAPPSEIASDQMKEAGDDWQSLLKFVLKLNQLSDFVLQLLHELMRLGKVKDIAGSIDFRGTAVTLFRQRRTKIDSA